MMKKTTIAALTAVLAFGLAACDNKGATPSPCDHLDPTKEGMSATHAQQLCEHYLHKSKHFNWY